MRLAAYFQSDFIEPALEAASAVSTSRNWLLADRLALYAMALVAFDESQPHSVSSAAFLAIYDNLRSHWKIFRNAQGPVWTADRVFTELKMHGHAMSLWNPSNTKVLLLADLPHDPQARAKLLGLLSPLAELKPMAEYPHMAVAKFTHIFNPGLFPIYDREVMWNRVIKKAFWSDYKDLCGWHKISTDETSERFNLVYTLWAAECIAEASPDLMPRFADWLWGQVSPAAGLESVLDRSESFQALAFEMIAIGAAKIEGAWR